MQSRKNGHRHVWLISGTGEGPILATALMKQGWEVTVSVVTAQASWPYLEMPLTSLLVGPVQGIEGIKEVLDDAQSLHAGFDWVLDATHPFALEISLNLEKACKEVGQPLLRFERPIEDVSGTFVFKDIKEIFNHSFNGKNVLIAIGARHLSEVVRAVRASEGNIFVRVLPTPDSLKLALKASLAENGLGVIRPFQGRYIGDFERALCQRWSIDNVICRESGGLTQKLWQEICRKENIDLLLLARPEPSMGVEACHNLNALLDRIST